MLRCDALIVGGGPAGSTCARRLTAAGWNVIVADRARFPRDKVCAGWITPAVFPLLDLTPAEYRASGLTFQEITGFRTGVFGGGSIVTRYPRIVSYAIRRCEFDTFLLRRSGARVLDGTPVTTIRRRGETWIINDEIEAPIVVGAAGHFCPVARHLRVDRDEPKPIIAKELEFRIEDGCTSIASDTPELFFSPDLEGYAWCVRKNDYLNVGIGRRDHGDFAAHVRAFIAFLSDSGRATCAAPLRWGGHAYHASGTGIRPLAADGALVVGDAAGLAFPESGEGIRPAIESGRCAGDTLVAAGGRFTVDDLRTYESSMRARHAPPTPLPGVAGPVAKAIGRTLLKHSRVFTRHVVLNGWFLRTAG
jgi:flavin-dependent dehydrogenase